ncbi:hypothetical protein HNY73_012040 [Argiope bruennichi]|uniref:Uncharacterized protein n=1 Tax=Argiope bruennichi TaxID=94029 RepID=A0A8T0ETN3_ARGBR|nr:hypothetical protein HNY73_012040 [Argiope bruennichi]
MEYLHLSIWRYSYGISYLHMEYMEIHLEYLHLSIWRYSYGISITIGIYGDSSGISPSINMEIFIWNIISPYGCMEIHLEYLHLSYGDIHMEYRITIWNIWRFIWNISIYQYGDIHMEYHISIWNVWRFIWKISIYQYGDIHMEYRISIWNIWRFIWNISIYQYGDIHMEYHISIWNIWRFIWNIISPYGIYGDS